MRDPVPTTRHPHQKRYAICMLHVWASPSMGATTLERSSTQGEQGPALRSMAILRRSPYFRNQRLPSLNVTKLAPGQMVMPARHHPGPPHSV